MKLKELNSLITNGQKVIVRDRWEQIYCGRPFVGGKETARDVKEWQLLFDREVEAIESLYEGEWLTVLLIWVA